MTVLEAIQRSGDFLARKGVDSPRLQAELLLAEVLGLPRMKLYLNFDRVLLPAEAEAYKVRVQRRGTREPLQHILGTVSFCGLELKVNRNVLIPRPETELLAEQAVQWMNQQAPPLRVLDFGTGSGCIAIAMAVACPNISVWALDISSEALAVAQENATRHGVLSRIVFVQSDGFRSVSPEQTFNLIVSNPPYIAAREFPELEPEVRDHDPHVALVGGEDGLEFYRLLAREAGPRVAAGGAVLLEFGDGQGPAVEDLFGHRGWLVGERIPDYSGRERILIARKSD